MSNWIRKANKFLVSEDGPTATEYAVMLALIIVVAIASIRAFGVNLGATFQMIANTIMG